MNFIDVQMSCRFLDRIETKKSFQKKEGFWEIKMTYKLLIFICFIVINIFGDDTRNDDINIENIEVESDNDGDISFENIDVNETDINNENKTSNNSDTNIPDIDIDLIMKQAKIEQLIKEIGSSNINEMLKLFDLKEKYKGNEDELIKILQQRVKDKKSQKSNKKYKKPRSRKKRWYEYAPNEGEVQLYDI